VILVLLAFLLLGLGLSPSAPQAPANDFHFSILGDRTGSAAPEIYGRIWREIDMLGPAFVINVGDTIQGGRDERAESDWQQVLPALERYRRYPLFLVPGNHDIWSEHSRRLFEKYAGRKVPYSFDYQNAHFVVLDNSQTTTLGTISTSSSSATCAHTAIGVRSLSFSTNRTGLHPCGWARANSGSINWRGNTGWIM
jgi:hypothetical protein